ncbi:MAG: hypothetical protein DRQ97_13905 [Gammaproteobacteria bacterium]|nr:MAG: hypothetical protein DRQ97_13905 [Gammaproteobacteria bacterium]
MNKARPMVNRQARLLAEQGYCVVVPDLYGTGDSSGDFGEADWARWCDDITATLHWIKSSGGQSVCLWGLRLGCLLASASCTARASNSLPVPVAQIGCS